MESAGHVMSYVLYVAICDCASSKKVRRLSGSSSSEICSSMSQVISSIVPDVTGISGVNSVGADGSMMIKACRGSLLIHPRWYV